MAELNHPRSADPDDGIAAVKSGRRHFLKGAAVVGAAAWAAPLIVSSPASAACPATVKCLPVGFSASDVTLTRLCSPSQGRLNFTIAGITCPCRVGGPTLSLDFTNSGWSSGSTVVSVLASSVAGQGTVSVTATVANNSGGTGAIPEGTYTPVVGGTLPKLSVSCTDRTGDIATYVYPLTITFSFPGPGSCDVGTNLNASVVAGVPTTSCR
jgi:hypothetical protein